MATPSLSVLTEQALSATQGEFDKYVVFPSDEARDATVLWALHTHVYRSFESTPRLSLRSTEPGSGKSRVLDILIELVAAPLSAVAITPSVMWRAIESGSPTILLDEADTIFGKKGSSSASRDLRAIINAGHRRGAAVPRCVGSDDVKLFHVFAPVALAGIGRLPDTIATRSVEIVMRKRTDNDPAVSAFRLKFAADGLAAAKAHIALWASCAAGILSIAAPELPVADRAADVWEPLVAIADLAEATDWPARAHKACARLHAEANEAVVDPSTRLLADIASVFDESALVPAVLTQRLRSISDGPWHSDDFTSAMLSRSLKSQGIEATTVRIDGVPTRAYKRNSFIPATP